MTLMRNKTVLMMAGGTGGHVYPALAVANILRDRGANVHWVGTSQGLEARVVPNANLPLHSLSVQGVRGKGLLQKLRAVFALVIALKQAIGLLRELQPDCVVGMGGYASAPAGLAARLLGKPLVIHEQNAVAGTTNRLLAPFAQRVLCAFDGAFAKRDAQIVGNPVRADLLERGAGVKYHYRAQRALRVLVVGGSLGAQVLNDTLPEALRRVQAESENGVEVRHQTGAAMEQQVRDAYAHAGINHAQVQAFVEDMAAAYEWADIVVCRAGALTVSELAIMGRPSVLVPLPHAIDDHQKLNAQELASVGASILLEQAYLSGESLASELLSLIASPEKLSDMASAARLAARPEAAEHVAGVCEEVCAHV